MIDEPQFSIRSYPIVTLKLYIDADPSLTLHQVQRMAEHITEHQDSYFTGTPRLLPSDKSLQISWVFAVRCIKRFPLDEDISRAMIDATGNSAELHIPIPWQTSR